MSKKRTRNNAPAYDPNVSHGILSVILLIAAIVILLSFFNKAGTVGVILNEWILSFLFGSLRFFTPIVLVILAWYLVADVKYSYRPTHGIGAVLFFIATSSLIHLRFPANDMWLRALEGDGGGVFGMFAWVLKTYLGEIAPWIILTGMIIISLILLFNTSIARFVGMHKKLMDRMGTVGTGIKQTVDTLFVEGEEDGEDEEDELVDDGSEEEIVFAKKKLGGEKVSENESDEEIDEEEEEIPEDDEDEMVPSRTGGPKTHVVEAIDDIPAWQKNVVIKKLPPLTLLETRKGKPTSGDIEENSEIIHDTLKEFGIEVDMGEVRVGPTVTQFSLKPAKGVKLSRITSLSNDLALALAAHPIRIEAPIPGQALVGIEVPNNKAAIVSLRELFESDTFARRPHNMMIGLGKDVGGKVWFADLPRMPHLLIAGATGSGKTVCMNTIITSLIYQNTAETLRMIMVDPKRVELTLYNGIPHLLTPVIVNTQQTVNALKWTISEMERRFDLLSKVGNRDLAGYNKAHPDRKLPHILFIIDELADLMATSANEVEAGIIRLAQMARAVGIHLVLATQRPSVDVITGLMKANIPGRIAFSVASLTDSRTILDASGAEKLLGRGDMLLQTAELSKPVRIQGAFISEEEVKNVADYLKGDEEPVYDDSITQKQKGGGTMSLFGGPSDDQDPLFEEAKRAILEAGKASASFLQRRLKVGYARAARILDELEEAGVIGPGDGAKPREILTTEVEVGEPQGQFNVYRGGHSDDEVDNVEEPEEIDEAEEDVYDEEDAGDDAADGDEIVDEDESQDENK